MLRRVTGAAPAHATPIGYMPAAADLNLDGVEVSDAALGELLAVDREAWRQECRDIEAFLGEYGARVPKRLHEELARVSARL